MAFSDFFGFKDDSEIIRIECVLQVQNPSSSSNISTVIFSGQIIRFQESSSKSSKLSQAFILKISLNQSGVFQDLKKLTFKEHACIVDLLQYGDSFLCLTDQNTILLVKESEEGQGLQFEKVHREVSRSNEFSWKPIQDRCCLGTHGKDAGIYTFDARIGGVSFQRLNV